MVSTCRSLSLSTHSPLRFASMSKTAFCCWEFTICRLISLCQRRVSALLQDDGSPHDVPCFLRHQSRFLCGIAMLMDLFLCWMNDAAIKLDISKSLSSHKSIAIWACCRCLFGLVQPRHAQAVGCISKAIEKLVGLCWCIVFEWERWWLAGWLTDCCHGTVLIPRRLVLQCYCCRPWHAR